MRFKKTNFVPHNNYIKMGLQADINWIKSEIEKVKDPFLVEAFKNLLNYRNHKQDNSFSLEELMVNRALNSEDDIANGRLLSREGMDSKTK